MIKLKTEVNKSAIMRDLHNEAVEIYKNAYEGEYAIEQFLYGAEKLFEKLRQQPVISSICTCRNSELEKDSLVPVYCHNCNAYVQTDL